MILIGCHRPWVSLHIFLGTEGDKLLTGSGPEVTDLIWDVATTEGGSSSLFTPERFCAAVLLRIFLCFASKQQASNKYITSHVYVIVSNGSNTCVQQYFFTMCVYVVYTQMYISTSRVFLQTIFTLGVYQTERRCSAPQTDDLRLSNLVHKIVLFGPRYGDIASCCLGWDQEQ